MPLALPLFGEVHIWQLNLDQCPGQSSLLSDDEVARAERFHFEQDARRWTAARSQLRVTLGNYLNLTPSELQFGKGLWGKPCLADCPLRFNISHSGGAALLAFAWQQEVGVDIEGTQRNVSPCEIAPLVFSDAEQAWLRASGEDPDHTAFLTLWTAKEAYVKARGKGLSFPMPQLTLIPTPASDRFLVDDLTQDAAWPAASVCRLNVGSTLFAAAALEGQLNEVRCFGHF